MSDPVPKPFAARPPSLRWAKTWWIADVAGAALFAACLAGWLAGEAGATGSPAAPWLLVGLAASGALRALVQGRALAAGQAAANQLKRPLRRRLHAALLPSGLVRGRLPGEDLGTAVDLVETADGHVGRFAALRGAAVAAPLACAALVALASPVAAAILLATLVPFAAAMALAGTAARAQSDRQIAALARLTGLFVDRARALPLVVLFAAEARVTRQIASAAHEVAERSLAVLRIAFVSSAVLEFFAALSVALVAVYCGFALLGLLPFTPPETLTLGEAFFALAMAPEFYLAMRRLAAAYHDKQQGEAAERVIARDLAEAEGHAAPPRLAAQTAAPPAPLRVEGLVVAYPDGNRIGPVDAAWPATGLHAVAGPTGAGKSTLLLALAGMAPAAQGTVRLAGEALAAAAALRGRIGWAGQRALLLPGTLEDNLLLGGGAGGACEWRAVAGALGLERLLAARGAALSIDPAGSGLSGGERRRIGVARAILSGRPILLLDEPTADLDAANAARVIAALEQAAASRLVIAATHDPALLARAASVVTLA